MIKGCIINLNRATGCPEVFANAQPVVQSEKKKRG